LRLELESLHADWPTLRILVLSMHADGPLAAGALRPARYLARRGGTELIDAVEAVAEGHSYLSQDITERAVAQCRDPVGGLARLSAREYEIFRRIVQGFGTSSIAQELQLSVKTVSTYKRRILDKLALDSAARSSAWVRSGIVDQADTAACRALRAWAPEALPPVQMTAPSLLVLFEAIALNRGIDRFSPLAGRCMKRKCSARRYVRLAEVNGLIPLQSARLCLGDALEGYRGSSPTCTS
jgi:DNA-binding NarL/FixJ family response regulator